MHRPQQTNKANRINIEYGLHAVCMAGLLCSMHGAPYTKESSKNNNTLKLI